MAWYRPKKQTTDNVLRIRIKDLVSAGFLQRSQSGTINWNGKWKDSSVGIRYNKEGGYLEISYTCNQSEAIRLQVPIVITKPHFGGERFWFKCPNCGKKVTSLYIRKRYFYCRECNNLIYRSQQYSFYDRMRLMSQKYESKAETNGIKKKGMHWSTYNELMDKAMDYDNVIELQLLKRLYKLTVLPNIYK